MSLIIQQITTDDPDWKLARAIRWKVFVEEQGCPPEEEWDEYDAVSHHYLGRADDRAVATARWRAVPEGTTGTAKLERFAVVEKERGQGYGRAMVDYLIDAAGSAGHGKLIVHAQKHLEPFYGSFGFERRGGVFDEVGIPHVKMVLDK